jgi:hypothetical protein
MPWKFYQFYHDGRKNDVYILFEQEETFSGKKSQKTELGTQNAT